MPKAKKVKRGRPKAAKRGRPKGSKNKKAPEIKRIKKVPDYVTGAYVIVNLEGDLILSIKEGSPHFTHILGDAETFPGPSLAKVELGEMISYIQDGLKPDDPEPEILKELLEAKIEPFKVFAAMHYSFPLSGKLVYQLVPFDQGQSLRAAIHKARTDFKMMVDIAREELTNYQKSLIPEENRIRKEFEKLKEDTAKLIKKETSKIKKQAVKNKAALIKELRHFHRSTEPKENVLKRQLANAVKELDVHDSRVKAYRKSGPK